MDELFPVSNIWSLSDELWLAEASKGIWLAAENANWALKLNWEVAAPAGLVMLGHKSSDLSTQWCWKPFSMLHKKRQTTAFTFRTDVGARDAHFDPVLLNLHLVAGTRSDAGAVVHHKII